MRRILWTFPHNPRAGERDVVQSWKLCAESGGLLSSISFVVGILHAMPHTLPSQYQDHHVWVASKNLGPLPAQLPAHGEVALAYFLASRLQGEMVDCLEHISCDDEEEMFYTTHSWRPDNGLMVPLEVQNSHDRRAPAAYQQACKDFAKDADLFVPARMRDAGSSLDLSSMFVNMENFRDKDEAVRKIMRLRCDHIVMVAGCAWNQVSSQEDHGISTFAQAHDLSVHARVGAMGIATFIRRHRRYI